MEVPHSKTPARTDFTATYGTNSMVPQETGTPSERGRANTFSGAISLVKASIKGTISRVPRRNSQSSATSSCNKDEGDQKGFPPTLAPKTGLFGTINPIFPSSIMSKQSTSPAHSSGSETNSDVFETPKHKGIMAILDMESGQRGGRGCEGYINYGTNESDMTPTESSYSLYSPSGAVGAPGMPHNDRSTTNLVGQISQEQEYIESPWLSLKQIALPFLIAGFGNVAAGIVLDRVQHWTVFVEVPALLILVPALLGLKGNVEMTLASRLSTHANLGHMDSKKDLKDLIYGNMSLVQCQASVVGFIAPLVAIALSYLHPDREEEKISFENAVMMVSSSVITANIANLLLGTLMCAVVLLSRKFNINPDNIATPIAASLGDFTTMFLLACIASVLYQSMEEAPWLSSVLLSALLLLTPIWAVIARSVEFTRKVVATGWYPIIGAMMLQNAGGLIMERALENFERLAAFQPVINGIGGNLCAIQSSRISTFLHQVADKRHLPISDPTPWINPFKAFFGPSPHAKMAKLLLALAIPSHLLFMIVIKLLKGHFNITVPFTLLYLASVIIHVTVLLYLAYVLVHFLWARGLNPDNNAIPILTAVADLFGSVLLAAAFVTLYQLNDENSLPFVSDEEQEALIRMLRNETSDYTEAAVTVASILNPIS